MVTAGIKFPKGGKGMLHEKGNEKSLEKHGSHRTDTHR
jgi:hypothetical protein